ncbi:MAG: SDR family NAD(P)-dependent oxidoreductase, partial [Woeseiaceae bacterium]
CRSLAGAGYNVAAIARSLVFWSELAGQLPSEGIEAQMFQCDVTNALAVRDTFRSIRERMGIPEVLVYNAGAFHGEDVARTSNEVFERLWTVNCLGAFLCAKEVIPSMVQQGRGAIVFTGATASVKPAAGFAAFGSSKSALRGLAQGMARELGPQGIHVAHVVIDGMIWTPRTRQMQGVTQDKTLQPDAIASTYLHIIRQPRSAWSFELDLRPDVEPF